MGARPFAVSRLSQTVINVKNILREGVTMCEKGTCEKGTMCEKKTMCGKEKVRTKRIKPHHMAQKLSLKNPFSIYELEHSNTLSESYEDVLVIARRLSSKIKMKKDSFREKKNVIF